MAVLRVEDIVTGSLDSTGSAILAVYSKVSGRYAVYRTADQVMIQYADDDQEGVNQRSALAPLASLRGQVNGLIDALRARPSAYHQAKATEYDRRVGLTLTAALQGDQQQALAELLAVKEDLTEDRASEVRARHLLHAAAATLIAILLARVLSSGWFAGAFGRFEAGVSPQYWNAAAVGALGAFFSIALQIRSRQVSIDLQSWDNIADAVLRIFVGAASAVILIALLNTRVLDVMVAGNRLIASTHGVIIAAFAAGFAERLVADFLSGFSVLGRRAAPVAPVAASISDQTDERSVAEGKAGDRKSMGEPLTFAAAPVAANAELAAEPDVDEAEVPDDEHLPGSESGDSTKLGPVG